MISDVSRHSFIFYRSISKLSFTLTALYFKESWILCKWCDLFQLQSHKLWSNSNNDLWKVDSCWCWSIENFICPQALPWGKPLEWVTITNDHFLLFQPSWSKPCFIIALINLNIWLAGHRSIFLMGFKIYATLKCELCSLVMPSLLQIFTQRSFYTWAVPYNWLQIFKWLTSLTMLTELSLIEIMHARCWEIPWGNLLKGEFNMLLTL